ncbi:MAG: hypothetical protein HYX79_00180 [Chloroflexi bacterium]|nr:hypothetical protein [Chloroflexota bacterium]
MKRLMSLGLRVLALLSVLFSAGLFALTVRAANVVVDMYVDADVDTVGIQNTYQVAQAGVDRHFFVYVRVKANTEEVVGISAYLKYDPTYLKAWESNVAGQLGPHVALRADTEVYVDYVNPEDTEGLNPLENILGVPTVVTGAEMNPVQTYDIIRFSVSDAVPANGGPTDDFVLAKVEFSTVAQIPAGGTVISFHNNDATGGKTDAIDASAATILRTAASATITQDPGITYTIDIATPQTAGVAADMTVTVKEGVNTKTDYVGTIQFTSNDAAISAGNGLPANYTFVAGDNGVHTFTGGVTFKTSGTRTVTGTDTGTPTITGTSGNVTVSAAVVNNLRVTGTAAMTAGTANQLTVTAYDEFGNVATGYENDRNLTFSGPAASAGGNTPTVTDKTGAPVDVGTATTFTFTAGVSTAGGSLVAYKAEVTTVDVTNGVFTSTGNDAWDLDLTVNPAAAANLRVTGAAAMTAGTANQLTITAYDAFGNVATGYVGDKSLTFSGPLASAGANTPTVTDKTGATVNVGTATTITFTAGVSTAGGSLVAYKAETPTVDVDDATINSTGNAAWDLDLTVNPAAAANLRVTGTAAMTAGTANQLTVTAYDAFGNVATAYTGDKSLTFSGPVASLDGNTPTVTDKTGATVNVGTATTITFTGGVSTAGGLLVAYKAETPTVDVNDGAIDSTGNLAWDLDLTVNLAVAASLRVTGTATMNAGAANQLTITAYDAFGNVQTGYTGDKSLTFSGPGVSALANAPTVTDKTGAPVNVGTATTITFTAGASTAGGSLVAYKAEVTTVDVTDGAISSTGNAAWDLDLTVNPVAAATLTVSGISDPLVKNVAVDVTVTAKDQYGNTATGYVGTIAFTSSDADAGVVLPANYIFLAGDNGTKTFTGGVKLQTVGEQAVTATDTLTGTITGTQTAITVVDITYTIDQFTTPLTAGTSSDFRVTVMQGLVVKTDYVGTIHFTSSDGQAVPPADYTFVAGDNGVKTFTAGVILKTSGNQTLTGTDTINAGITGTANFVVNAAAAANLRVTGTAAMTAGTANQLTVTAYDGFGNVATAYTGDKSLTFSGPTASAGGNTPTVTDKTGAPVNVGSGTTITFTAGVSTAGASLVAYKAEVTTVDVAGGGLDSTGNAAWDLDLTVNPAAANNLRVTGTATMTVGTANQLTITAYDAFGNVATAYVGDKNLTFSGPAASAGGNTPTVTDKTGAPVNVGVATTTTFTAGVSTAGGSLVAYKAEVTTVDVDDATINSTGNVAWDLDLTVNPAAANNLRVTGTAAMVAGASNELTVTAYDQYGNVATGYTGSKNLTFSGPSAIGSFTPKVEGNAIGIAASFNFTSGVTAAGAATLQAYLVEVTTVDVTDQTINSSGNVAWDLDLTVTPAGAATLTVSGIADPITKNVASGVTVTAKDAYGNTATTYTGAIHFTSSDSSATLPGNYTFVGGDNGTKDFAGGVTLQTYGDQSVTATDTVTATITGSQTAITVIPVITVTYNLPQGWNMFSVPFSLEDGYRSFGEMATLQESLTTDISVAYYYDPDYTVSGVSMPWRQVTSAYDLYPGDAIYVKVAAAGGANMKMVANTLPAIPSKNLEAGWNMVGLGYYAAGATGMPVDQALISIFTVASNYNGYAQVVSPALNQPGFIYLRGNPGGGAIPDMKISKGYWVFMTNAGTLGGFTATPLP